MFNVPVALFPHDTQVRAPPLPPFHPGAKVKVFDHNDPAHLEAVLRSAIAEGQPRTGRPWKKIVRGCC